MIGETIKDFTITAQLGRGGMGEVFVGEQRLIKTKVAIKMLRPEISIDKAHVDRFFNEAIAVSKIRHAGIVKIFDVGFHASRAYLVMELLEGEPLSSRLRQGLPFAKALDFARQLTSVLDATHAAGITHRDLKPDNIFLVPDAELGERVRVLDFGIAKLGDVAATAASMSMGTPSYMPPELWKDAATSGPATDVYALGCILFELLCGRPPFTVTAIAEACGKHLSEIPPRVRSLRPELPAALDDLIANMLEKEQADRPTTKQIATTLATLAQIGIGPSAPIGAPTRAGLDATKPSGEGVAAGRTPGGGVVASAAPATGSAGARTAIGHDSATGSLPRDPAVSDDDAALVTRYEGEARWADVVKLLGKQVEVVARPNKAAFYLRIAGIYHDRFANMAEAIKAYEHVLEHEAGNRRAIEPLRSLYEKRRDWEKLLELEKGELDRTPPEKRADKAVEVARLASSRIGKPDVTIYWWQRVLEQVPDHPQAMTELAKSFERAGRWIDLTSVLEHQAEVAAGNDDRIAALVRIATIQEDQLSDDHAAHNTWQRVLELDPKHATALARLANTSSSKPPAASSHTAPAKPAVARSSAESSSEVAKSQWDTGYQRENVARERSSADPNSTGGSAGTAGSLGDAAARESERREGSRNKTSTMSADAHARRRSPTVKIAIGVAVLAVAGIAIYFATRSPRAAERDLGATSPALIQALTDGHVAYRVVDGRVLVAADAPQIQIAGQVIDGGTGAGTGSDHNGDSKSAGSGSAGTGSAGSTGSGTAGATAQAAANGLTLSYRVLSRPASGGEFHVVAPNDELHTDDRIAFEIRVSESAHVYLSQRPKAKALSVVFPMEGIAVTNPLPAETWVRIPTGDKSFRLNQDGVGIETVYIVAARHPLASLASAITSEGKLKVPTHAVEDQLVAVAMEKRGDCSGRGRDIVLDGDDACKVKTRGLELDDEPVAKPAHRVRGLTVDDAIFVPFRFRHLRKF